MKPMADVIHRFSVTSRTADDPRAASLLAAAHAIGFTELTQLACEDRYFLEGSLSETEKRRLAAELLSDPIAQEGSWQMAYAKPDRTGHVRVIEAALRPGVTDPIAEQILRGAKLLGIQTLHRVATGQRFTLSSSRPLNDKELHRLAQRLLVNPVIHHYALDILSLNFPNINQATHQIETIALRNLDTAQLVALSIERRAALDEQEMLAIQAYYRQIERDPTDVEFETIAQTWSEHCSHKTFRANITCDDGSTVPGLLKTYIRAATETINAPWVASAFVDNAGIIDFDEEYQIAFKVETHNHPSAIEPFGGANTGLGGVIRDVLGVSAKPIAATDIFCFGPQDVQLADLPEGVLHPRRIQTGVVAGVQDYGNKTGIPTVNGAIFYNPGYISNPLVYCGCVGLLPKNSHKRAPQPGDRIVVLGGRTGRDGLRGATFSSMTMDAQTGEVAGASVQIGDPVIAKGLIEVVTRARDLNLYTAITDCGAGGLSSAVGEMASNTGADVDLKDVPLKYAGLEPWEIWLSEAQERMVLAVPAANLAAVQTICDTYSIELTNLGEFTATGHLVVRYQNNIMLDLANEFLFDGMPQREMTASLPSIPKPVAPMLPNINTLNCNQLILQLLSHPNIASKERVIRRYDHEVQGATVIKPLTGVLNDGPSDACVLRPLVTKGKRGIVLSNGLNPLLGLYDPYRMAVSVIDEAVRNAVAVGADPDRLAILDNFCWGDPKRASTLGDLVAANRGCCDAAMHYRTPFISGKDSLNNEYVSSDGARHAIPPTLLISAIGIIEDINNAVTMDFKTAGSTIYLLGSTQAEFAGSHLQALIPTLQLGNTVPGLPSYTPSLYRTLHQAMRQHLVEACHDLSEGGLAIALAEMCIAGRLGCQINLPNNDDALVSLFSESNGRLLVAVAANHCQAFEQQFTGELQGLVTCLGTVTENNKMIIQQHNKALVTLSVDELVTAWQN